MLLARGEHRPIAIQDPPAVLCKKVAKVLLAAPPLRAALLRAVSQIERMAPGARFLPPLY